MLKKMLSIATNTRTMLSLYFARLYLIQGYTCMKLLMHALLCCVNRLISHSGELQIIVHEIITLQDVSI